LLNKHQISGGGASLHCYCRCCRISGTLGEVHHLAISKANTHHNSNPNPTTKQSTTHVWWVEFVTSWLMLIWLSHAPIHQLMDLAVLCRGQQVGTHYLSRSVMQPETWTVLIRTQNAAAHLWLHTY